MKQSIIEELSAHLKDLIENGKVNTQSSWAEVQASAFCQDKTYFMGEHRAMNWLKLHGITREDAVRYLQLHGDFSDHVVSDDFSPQWTVWVLTQEIGFQIDYWDLQQG